MSIPEKKKFLEGKSTFVASVLPELKAYQRFVNRLIGDGNSTVEESQFQSNCEEVVKVYKYAFELMYVPVELGTDSIRLL